MSQYYFTSFADAYSCGAYGAGSFDEGTACTTSTPSSNPTNNSGGLTNTGANFYVPLVIGVVLIAAAMTILIISLKKRSKKSNR